MSPPSTASALSRLRAGGHVHGVLQTMPSSAISELAILVGFDFVILDCEHGLIDAGAHLSCLQVISATPAFSAVRVRPHDLHAVGRYLDLGADAILMPNVRNTQEAKAFVAAATHGPRGTRSSTGSGARASRYGLGAEGERAEPLLLAMIESREAVNDIEAIANTLGLGGFVIGPHDLSSDLGCEKSTLAYLEAVTAIEGAAKRAHLVLGTGAYAGAGLDALKERGYRFILSSVDVLALRDGLGAHLAAACGVS
ncbi:HpcH/HpaI aldolase family protein [Terricaulis silvestris]|uniref:4-hydroxy-2-oxo-heptane-1,7-dioate aldolase n=1 Tax=Terricaulis silvestris TaxID=2686094 RepID=A0A6I6MTA4_9CAUL|nr:aldolase/citrate lyase family protein [Terricaulis silvestris]QGZ94932.1 4-hydroxy-2-oxo-heptane-1,7-dioate aldolase [Terricaulis silvestris]